MFQCCWNIDFLHSMGRIFDSFINKYSLSKTLRFELKPHPLSRSLTEVISKDKEIDRLYNEEMKPMFDDLHEKFIRESLAEVEFTVTDLKQLERYFEELKNLKQKLKNLNKNKEDNEKEIENTQKEIKEFENEKSGKIPKQQTELREIVVKRFNVLGSKWKDHYEKEGIKFKSDDNKEKQGYEILTTKGVLGILKHLYPEKRESISKFDKFFTYFKGFNQNRANYYTSDQKATAVANRTININLNIFIKNKDDFSLFLSKFPKLKNYKAYFELSNFRNCLTQIDIERYNEKIGEVKLIVNLEYNQKVEDKKDILKGLNKLQKQIGCKIKQEREQLEKGESIYPKYLKKIGLAFHITKDTNDKYQIWESLSYLNEKLIPRIKKLRENYKNFYGNWQNYKLDEIWFRKESLNTISGRWFGGNNWAVLTKALAYLGIGKIDKGEYKSSQFISLQELKEAMEALEDGVDFDIKKSKKKANGEESTEGIQLKNTKQYFYKPENLFRDEYKNIYEEKTLFDAFLAIWQHEVEFKFKEIFDGYVDKEEKTVKSFLQSFEDQKQKPFDKSNGEHIKAVFNLMQEGYLPLLQMTKYHNLEKEGEIVPGYSTEDKFYETLNEFWGENPINQYRRAFEATLTQKPYSEEKIKLNFENPSLAEGWDISLEPKRKAVILRKYLDIKNRLNEKEYDYYLAVIDKNVEFPFDKGKRPALYQESKEDWEKMEYKYLKDASLSIPKCSTQVNLVKNHFKVSDKNFVLERGSSVGKFTKPLTISREIFELNNRIYLKDDCSKNVLRGQIKKADEKNYVKLFQKEFLTIGEDYRSESPESSRNYGLYRAALDKWIDYCKEFLTCYPSCSYFDYSSLKNAEEYESVDKFYQEVDRLSYVKSFVKINYIELEKLIQDGTIYFFHIYNKDFSNKKIKKDGKDSLSTLTLKSLFSEQNLSERIIKLNGETELFFRDKSIKKEKDEKRSKTFDIFKNKRYTEEKCFFHFPLTMNFGTKDAKQKEFNQEVWKTIARNKQSIRIIGIDRGEKHLMYYSIISIDENGSPKIEDQGSFNKIETKSLIDEKKLECEYDEKGQLKKVDLVSTGKKVNYVDYHLLLDFYEKKRSLARKSWEVIGKIKDLKEGYLSQVIHKIYNLILEHNAIVVMEDLNVEFKAKRGAKVEKSVYKKFELALARKLGHLILKDRKPFDKGGVLQPYQLTPLIQVGKIGDFEKAKQWGIMFYVQPHYTSTTDPLSGWRKHLYISNSAPIEKRKENSGKTKKSNSTYIKDFFNPAYGVQINYDSDKNCFRFSYQDQADKPWNLYAYEGLTRFYYNSHERQVKSYDLHDKFGSLFTGLDKHQNINEQIFKMEKFDWTSLVFLWNLLNQIRNTDKSKEGNENDFLQSPHWAEKYNCFFDSRKTQGRLMPDNGDANGAYNIARKGLMMLGRISEHGKIDPKFKKYPDLFISNYDWDNFVTKPPHA